MKKQSIIAALREECQNPSLDSLGFADTKPKTRKQKTSLSKTIKPLDFLQKIKRLSEPDASKRIDDMTAGLAVALAPFIVEPEQRKLVASSLGEAKARRLIHAICTKTQQAVYEADQCSRLQSIKNEDDGLGLYIQQAPLGGIGAEIGLVHRKTENGSSTTWRGAAGFYLRASNETCRLDSAHLQKGIDAIKAVIG